MSRIHLQQFLDGGILPFTGRRAEIERILSFWSETAEVNGIRAALVVGEAGCGKSRLVEAIIPNIFEKGGAVVHAKLRPEGIASIGALLAPALWASESAGTLLKREPQGNLSSVVAALRRVVGLRRTILIIEDIHLLEGTAAQEFSLLLETLADDPITILTTTRPTELPIRNLLKSFIGLEIPLNLLEPDDLRLIWQELFDDPPEQATLDILWNATLGNPLAVRSALRGALNSGALLPDDNGGVMVAGGVFADVVRRSTERLTQGMIAHLGRNERRAAELLACLGESFSFEAIDFLLGEAGPPIVARLKGEGILVSSLTPSVSINGAVSTEAPIAFSHTLLHNTLVAGAEVNPADFISLLGERLPLYSTLPYQIVAHCRVAPQLESLEIINILQEIRDVAVGLNRTTDWQHGTTILDAGYALFKAYGWRDEALQLSTSLDLTMAHINLVRQRQDPEQYKEMVHYCLESAARLLQLDRPQYRLYALTFFQEYLFHSNDAEHWKVWDDVQEFLADYPDYRFRFAYIEFLREAFHFAGSSHNKQRIQLIEQELITILESEGTDQEMRDYARVSIGKYLLMSFETPEELQRREVLLSELETIPGDDIRKRPWTIEFYFRTGRIESAIALCDQLLPFFKETSLWQSYHSATIYKMAGRIFQGHSAENVIATWLDILNTPAESSATLRQTIQETSFVLYSSLLLRGDYAAARRVITMVDRNVEEISLVERLLLKSGEHRQADGGTDLTKLPWKDDNDEDRGVAEFIAAIFSGTPVTSQTILRATDLIRPAPIEIRDLSIISAFLFIVEEADRLGGIIPTDFVEEILYPAVIESLRWCAAQNLSSLISPLLVRSASILSAEEREEWDGTASEHKVPEPVTVNEERTHQIQIAMFGTMTVQEKKGTPVRLRGGRNQTLLGTLVADVLRSEPLDRMDFLALATGDLDDPDKARRSMNVAVLRLREVIGRDAILTEGETPRLNTEYASVDLLDAWKALRNSRRYLRENELLPARTALMQVLQIWKGDVPFPGLYADLFEELREQFEIRTRNAIIALGKKLLEADDNIGAEELLGQAFTILPDDEEVGELLRRALGRLGKLADSQWVSMKAAEEEL